MSYEQRNDDELIEDSKALRQAQRILSERIDRYDAIFRGTDEMLWSWDPAHDTLDIDPQFERILGYSPGELDASVESWTNQVHPEDRSNLLATFRKHLDRGGPYNLEFRVRKKDGSHVACPRE